MADPAPITARVEPPKPIKRPTLYAFVEPPYPGASAKYWMVSEAYVDRAQAEYVMRACRCRYGSVLIVIPGEEEPPHA